MRAFRRKLLTLEQLEDRMTPALTLSFYAGSLTISGTPSNTLTIAGTGGTSYSVTDGAHTLGSFNITGNLTLNLASHPGFITLNLNGQTFAGNVLMNLGVGNTSQTAIEPIFVYGGTTSQINGNLTVNGGSGDEALELGVVASNTPSTLSAVTIRGNVTMTASSTAPPSGLATSPTTLELSPGSNVTGNITTTQVGTVNIGFNQFVAGTALSRVGGNLTANDATGKAALFVDIAGDVGKNVNFTGLGRPDFAGNGDSLAIIPKDSAGAGIAGGAVIGGNVSVNLGSSSINKPFINVEFDSDGVANPFVINGNVSINSSGSSSDSITFGLSAGVQNQINGSVTMNLGSGSDSIAIDHTSIFGNTNIAAGNGNETVTITSNAGLFGNLGFQFGNGNESVSVQAAPAGTLSWRSGNGNSMLSLNPASGTTTSWNVNLLFGNGNDSLTLAPVAGGGTATISGSATAGTGTNTFSQGAGWTTVSPWSISGF